MTVEVRDDSDRVRRRDLPRDLWLLVLARAVNRLGAFTLAFLTVVLVDRGATLAQAGIVAGAFGAATIPSRLAGGVLADRLGRVPTICVGLVGCAVGQCAVALAPGVGSAAVGAVVLGLAFELYEPPSQALVADLTTDRERPVAYGLLGAALAAAGAVAGLLAAWLGGVDLRLLLLVDAATCLVTAVLVGVWVRDVGPGVAAPAASPAAASPWRDRRLLAMLVVGTGFAVVYLSLVTGLPLLLAARGLPAAQAGLLLTVSAVTVVLAQPVLTWRALAGDGFRAMTVGYVVLALGLVATGSAASLPAFVVATMVWSLGDVLLLGHATTVVSRLAPAGSRGGYLASYGLSWGIATTVAPLVGTGLLAVGGPRVLGGALALVAVALAAVQPALGRLCRRPALRLA